MSNAVLKSVAALILSLFCALLAPIAMAADPYTVNNIHVDVSASSAQEAQSMARAQGQGKAANILINRMSLATERTAKGFHGVSDRDGAKMIRSIKIDNEKRSANRYIGDLNVDFNPHAIAQYMRLKGLTLIATQSRERLVIPVLEGQSLWGNHAWASAWKSSDFSNSLTPLRTLSPRSGLDTLITDPTGADIPLSSLRSIGAMFGVEQILIATAIEQGAGFSVTLTDVALDSGQARTLGPVTGVNAYHAAAQAVSALEEDWKANAISPKTSSSTVLPVTILYNSLAEWQKLQDIINNSAQIRAARLEAISRRGALMRLSYGGDLERLKTELAFKGLHLSRDEHLGMVLRRSVRQ